MKVSVRRSGGFAGVVENIVDLDTTQLDSSRAQQVEDQVRNLGFFNLQTVVSEGGVGSDFFRYEITVVREGRVHTVAFTDDDSPVTAPLRRFVEGLMEMG